MGNDEYKNNIAMILMIMILMIMNMKISKIVMLVMVVGGSDYKKKCCDDYSNDDDNVDRGFVGKPKKGRGKGRCYTVEVRISFCCLHCSAKDLQQLLSVHTSKTWACSLF